MYESFIAYEKARGRLQNSTIVLFKKTSQQESLISAEKLFAMNTALIPLVLDFYNLSPHDDQDDVRKYYTRPEVTKHDSNDRKWRVKSLHLCEA